jgi:hypothetical protein
MLRYRQTKAGQIAQAQRLNRDFYPCIATRCPVPTKYPALNDMSAAIPGVIGPGL